MILFLAPWKPDAFGGSRGRNVARGSGEGGGMAGGLDVGLLKIPPGLAQGKIIFNEQNDWVVSQVWVHQRRSEKENRPE